MKFALDSEGNKIHISKTHVKNDYFCPECGEKLVLKKGDVREHHFAHQRNTECIDTWHYDMSYWHQKWQSKFPLENQEIVLTKNGIKHRADILINNTVIEFQHSPLSSNEFEDRNDFYTSLGYRVVWVFDMTDLWDCDRIIGTQKDNIFKWTHPKNTFDLYDYKNKNIDLYFQTSLDEEDYPLYDSDYAGCTVTLIKISWVAPSGFERFAIDGNYYDEDDFIYQFVPKKLTKDDLYDILICHYSKGQAQYLYGCPLSSTHYAIDNMYDISESEYSKYRPCQLCKYSGYTYINGNCKFICRQRVSNIEIPEKCDIVDIKRTYGGQIYSITISENEKAREIKVFPLVERLEDSIINIWNKINPERAAVFENIKTGKHIKICGSPIKQLEKYKKCYGYISKDGWEYSEKTYEIYDYDKKQWICTWHK